jgi:hypothetical protein
MLLKVRVIALGFLALLVVGAIASAASSANPGPFWNHREKTGENGLKISAQAPEAFYGTGGPQELKGNVGIPVILRTAGVKITGFIWNNGLQGQIKLRLKYPPITIIEPIVKECQPEVFSQVGAHNVVYSEGHLAWTWNGEEPQRSEQPVLNQKPAIIFVPPGTQIQQGATALPTGTFAEVKFTGAGCGVLAGTFPVTGTTVGKLIQPANKEEWSNTFTFATPEGKVKQHFWNGIEFRGVETGLTFAGNPASLIGENTIETIRQEISIFEK